MRYITFDTGTPGEQPLLRLDLGEPSDTEFGYYSQGDLAVSDGNLYIHVDGVEWGSLYFWSRNGKPSISLGQYDPWEEQWVDRNPLAQPTEGDRDPQLERMIEVAADFWTHEQEGRVIPGPLAAQVDLIIGVVGNHPAYDRAWVERQIRLRVRH